MLSPSTDALMTGNALSASVTALITKGRKVILTPLRASKSPLMRSRSLAMFVKSTSKKVVTCAEVRLLVTMCSAIFFRIRLIGSTLTRSPGANALTAGAAGAGAGAGAFAAGAGADGAGGAGAGFGAVTAGATVTAGLC